MPEAALKVYLDASVGERARRRYEELRGRGEPADLEAIRLAVLERDRIDSTRDFSPLRPAEDAVIVNSDEMDVDQVVGYVNKLLERTRAEG